MGILKRESGQGFAATESTAVATTNTTTETTIFSQTISGGKMGTVKELNLELFCMLSTPLVSLPTMTIKIKFGAASITIASGLSVAVSLSNEPFLIRGKIINKTATTQIMYALISQGSATLPLLLSTTQAFKGAKWTVDTSADNLLAVTNQFSILSNSTTLSVEHASIALS